jgi:dihydrofolate synthase/folylpolyglutamate synthase
MVGIIRRQARLAQVRELASRSIWCGMLNTKDIGGYLTPLAAVAESLTAVSIPGEANTIPAERTAEEAVKVGLPAQIAESVPAAIGLITDQTPHARILICGSLYLAGHVMRENAQ